jgi:hypothetical protein
MKTKTIKASKKKSIAPVQPKTLNQTGTRKKPTPI